MRIPQKKTGNFKLRTPEKTRNFKQNIPQKIQMRIKSVDLKYLGESVENS